MPIPCTLSSTLILSCIGLSWLAPQPAWAELYKCQHPNGRITYQQTACAGQTEGETLSVDTQGPSGRAQDSLQQDYSIAAQAERMRAEREALNRARRRARRQAEAEAQALRAASRSSHRSERDPAKCAKHRGEAAKWKQKVMHGYHTRAEKDYNANTLAHHQALMERYCD